MYDVICFIYIIVMCQNMYVRVLNNTGVLLVSYVVCYVIYYLSVCIYVSRLTVTHFSFLNTFFYIFITRM